jgi:hypothetical protein
MHRMSGGLKDRKEMKKKRCARDGRVPGELIGGRLCAWPSAAHTFLPSHRSSCQTPSSSNSTYEQNSAQRRRSRSGEMLKISDDSSRCR